MNLTNEVTLSLEVPILNKDNKEFCETLLETQTEFLVGLWRDVLASYKMKGIAVPGISIRHNKTKATKSDNKAKEFITKLLEHHLQYMPNDNVGAQIKVIKILYATGKTAEELIDLYEESRENYKLTTWFTVKYNLSKPTEEPAPAFERRNLGEEDKAEIISRLKGSS